MPDTHTSAESRLSPGQVEAYRRDGYLIYDRPVLPEDKFIGLKAYFEKMLADLPEGYPPEMMDVPHLLHPELLKWAMDDAVLDLVEPIIGPNIALLRTQFICKPKYDGKRVAWRFPWHEDSKRMAEKFDPMEMVTLWFAIDPAVKENGCIRVIPGTHRTGRKGYSDYTDADRLDNYFRKEIVKEQRDEGKGVYIELQPNRCFLYDPRIQHTSESNTSNLRRAGWVLRFTPTSVKFDERSFNGCTQVYLARGRDLGGNSYGDPTKACPEMVAKRYPGPDFWDHRRLCLLRGVPHVPYTGPRDARGHATKGDSKM